MPLRDSVSGDGKILQKAVTTRYYTVGEDGSFINYREVTVTESRIWTALTRGAAEAQVNQNTQPNDPKAVYTWSAKIENPSLGSYSVQRDYQKTTTTKV